jgi:hypothetical protein
MSGLPDILRIPEGPEKCLLPARDLALSDLIIFQLPPQRKSTIFANASDYLSDLSPTISLFAMQPFEPSDGCLALRKLMANGRWMADKIESVYAFFS